MRWYVLLLFLVMVMLTGSVVRAETKQVDDRTLVSLASLAPMLGAVTDYNPEIDGMTFSMPGRTIQFALHTGEVYINGIPVELDEPIGWFDGQLMLPARSVRRLFGAHLSLPNGGVMLVRDVVGRPERLSVGEEDRPVQDAIPPAEPGPVPPLWMRAMEEVWPGAILRPDGSAFLPTGLIINPAMLDMSLWIH